MVKRMVLYAILVGVVLYVSDLALGWMTMFTGPIPVIFIITVVVGIIAGQIADAVWATFATWLIGILVGCLFAPIIFAEFWTDDGFLPILPLLIMMWSTRGMFMDFEFEGSLWEAVAVAAGLAIIWLILTPMLYLFSFGLAALAGFIGKKIHEKFGIGQEAGYYPTTETSDAQQ